jgi:hypothetical protein
MVISGFSPMPQYLGVWTFKEIVVIYSLERSGRNLRYKMVTQEITVSHLSIHFGAIIKPD